MFFQAPLKILKIHILVIILYLVTISLQPFKYYRFRLIHSRPLYHRRMNRFPFFQVSTLFLKALRILSPLKHIPFPQVRCGPWKIAYVCSCNHFRKKQSLLSFLYLLCTLYFIFCKEFSYPWYHLILLSACEADYRNLIHRPRKQVSERLHDFPKDTQQQSGNVRIHTDVLWSQEQTFSHYIKAASISEWPDEQCSRVTI